MYKAHRYITIDSSPKAGQQMLGGKQQNISWPRASSLEKQVYVQLQLDRDYFPLASLLYGENPINEKLFRLDSKNNIIYFAENKLIQSATLFDINGKLVIHESFPLTQFDVSALPKGNYILSIVLRSSEGRAFKINIQ